MGTLYIRNVPDEVVERIRERAKRENRSMNAEIVRLLRSAVGEQPVDYDALWKRLDRRAERLLREHGPFDDVVDVIREGREER